MAVQLGMCLGASEKSAFQWFEQIRMSLLENSRAIISVIALTFLSWWQGQF